MSVGSTSDGVSVYGNELFMWGDYTKWTVCLIDGFLTKSLFSIG